MLDTAFGIACAAFFLITIAYMVSLQQLYNRLKRHHQSVYESIGGPTLFLNNTQRNGVLLLRWLWRRDYENLGDAKTAALAKRVWILLLLVLASLALATALLVAGDLESAPTETFPTATLA